MITYVIILIGVLLLGIPTIYLVNKQPKLRLPFQLFYAIVIVVLAILLVININKPIDFEKEVKLRSAATIEKLKDIRDIQEVYKDKYGKYTASFDTLISFVADDSLAIEAFEQVGEWNQDEMTKEQALREGILIKRSTFLPVKDSLWNDKRYAIENIRYIPFTDNVEFSLGAGELETASKVKVKVLECYAKYHELFVGLDKQLVINYIDTKTKYGGFDGIRIGSLEETTNNAGNWEK
jgi:hypothetical protein